MTLTEAQAKLLKYSALWGSAAAFAYWVYWNYYGRPSTQKRKDLENELEQVRGEMDHLDVSLLSYLWKKTGELMAHCLGHCRRCELCEI